MLQPLLVMASSTVLQQLRRTHTCYKKPARLNRPLGQGKVCRRAGAAMVCCCCRARVKHLEDVRMLIRQACVLQHSLRPLHCSTQQP